MENNENRREYTITFNQANFYSLIFIIPILIIYGIPYYLIWGMAGLKNDILLISNSLTDIIIFFLSLVIGIIIHEFIHGIFWALKTKQGWDSIDFGINWKALAPYAHCNESLRAKKYYPGVVMPGIILGLIPAIAGIITGNAFLWIYGFIFTMAAGGDAVYLIMLLRLDGNPIIQDHPEKVGFIIYD